MFTAMKEHRGMSMTEAATDEPGMVVLTGREADVLRLLRDGLSDREIAETLRISPNTVRTHLGALSDKLGVRRRMRIAVQGERLGLV